MSAQIPRSRSPLAVWLATRAVMAALAVAYEWNAGIGDVAYYFSRISQPGTGLTLPEYPVPAWWLVSVPRLFANDVVGYQVAFVAMMALLDLGLVVWLQLTGETRTALWWTLLTFLIGPLCYFRFDLAAAIAVVVALVSWPRRPHLAGVALALGTGLKLWPALPLLAFAPLRRRLRPLLLAFTISGLGLIAGSVAFAGWTRLVSPLRYQGDRGLEVGSVWATGPMLARLVAPDAYRVEVSPWAAFEIFGPGVGVALQVATAVTAAGLLALVAAAITAFRRRADGPDEIAGLAALAVLVLIVGNKTLSPQYLCWLAAPLAVLLPLLPARATRWTSLAAAALMAATHLTYPLMAGMFTTAGPGIKRTLSTVTLAGRNGLLVVFTIGLAVWWWRRLGRPPAPTSGA